MKLERVWLPVLIVLLIAGSAFVVFGTKTDPKTHKSVALFPVHYGLDIKGGIRAVLRADVAALPKNASYDPTLVQQILENRVNASGVAEATVQPKGTDQFIVELPDVHDKQAILNRIGTTAQMTFYNLQTVKSDHNPNGFVSMQIGHDKDGHDLYTFVDQKNNYTFRDGAQIKADLTTLMEQGYQPRVGATLFTIPSPLSEGLDNPQVYFTPDQQKHATDLSDELSHWQDFLNSSPPILTGSDGIEPSSHAQLGQTGLEPIVTQEFTSKGADAMAAFTSNHVGDYMGIVLDDRMITAPVIQSEITDQGEISGGFASLKEAQDIADLLNAGALPVPLKIIQVEDVEASLGKGAVSQSLKAGVAGLILVLVFMAVWYKLPGLVADVALIIYSLLTMALYRGALAKLGLDPVTMTLPGIAGFILSIGMAVDANILIFERMKEELANGKTPRAAIDAGFNRAFPAIRDSNICTIITCIVLLSMGTASVKGFALTLMIGVVVSLFSAVTITRTLLFALVEAGHVTDPAQLGYRPRPAGAVERKLNIIGRRKFFYLLSGLIIVPGLIFYAMGGLKKSIEFTGGSQIEVKYNQKIGQDKILASLAANGLKDSLVQMASDPAFPNSSIVIVSTQQRSEFKADNGENLVQQKLEGALPGQIVPPSAPLPPSASGLAFTLNGFDKVDGIISAELTSRAIQAVIVASICIVLFLAMVFSIGGFVAGLRLGTSAIAALLHDVLVLLGVFSIAGYFAGWKIDSLFVTAMLTVIGFSVHDTVVIFDRVRENLRHRQKGENFEQLVNRSIQQTLNRSLRTSGTVLMTLLTLLIFGGHTTFQLDFALFVGILSGTYSSIFNAASILVDWENWLAKRRGNVLIDSSSPSIATAAAGASASSNGGYQRPVYTRPATPIEAANGSTDDADEIGISRLKGKKKKPARRF